MRGLYAGSFDPIHLGHLAIVEAAAQRMTMLWVAAVGNPEKTSGMFTLAERRRLIELSTRHLGNVGVVTHYGLLVDLAERLGVDVLVRGAASRGREQPRPAPKEMAAEHDMAATNERISGVPTMFVPTSSALAHLGARHIRTHWQASGVDAIRSMVPVAVADALAARPLPHPRTSRATAPASGGDADLGLRRGLGNEG